MQLPNDKQRARCGSSEFILAPSGAPHWRPAWPRRVRQPDKIHHIQQPHRGVGFRGAKRPD
eukprot:379372-Pyramimonas_sp.AAC.1